MYTAHTPQISNNSQLHIWQNRAFTMSKVQPMVCLMQIPHICCIHVRGGICYLLSLNFPAHKCMLSQYQHTPFLNCHTLHISLPHVLLHTHCTTTLPPSSLPLPLSVPSPCQSFLLPPPTYIHTWLYTQLGKTALHFHAKNLHMDIVDNLLEANADPDLAKKVTYTTPRCFVPNQN